MTMELIDVGRAPRRLEEATSNGEKRRPVGGDEKLALTLQRELNGLRQRRGRSSTRRTHGALASEDLSSSGVEPSSLKRQREVTSSSPQTEASERGEVKLQKKQRVASRPMVYHEDTRLWYRAQVVSRRGENEVKVSWDGLDDQFAPVWLACSSERIWKGSMRNKDWKYVSGGGWLPKCKSSSAKKSVKNGSGLRCRIVQNPATPPLVSPHNSCSETTSVSEDLHSLKSSDLEETVQRISFECDATTTTSSRREGESNTNVNTNTNTNTNTTPSTPSAGVTALKVVIPNVKVEHKNDPAMGKRHSKESQTRKPKHGGQRKGNTTTENESKSHLRFVKIKEERHDLPIKMLMKKAFATV